MPTTGPIKVLVVDDVESVHMVAERVLKKDGFEVMHAMSGQEALEMVQKTPEIRMVVLDIVMPDMSGYEVMQRLVQIFPKPQRPKVCFLSGKRNKEDVVKAIAIGGDDYIVKPIDPDAFRTKIRTLLGLHAANEFGILSVSLRARLIGSQIVPDIVVTEISETEVIARSTAGVAPGMVLELNIQTLAQMVGWEHSFGMRVKECRRARHAVYVVKMEFVGLSEEMMQKVRSLVIRGAHVADPGTAADVS